MKKLLLIALLVSGGIAHSATTEQITNALAKYCVPDPKAATCGTEVEGKYSDTVSAVSKQNCLCHQNTNSKAKMQYIQLSRKCEAVCAKGYKSVPEKTKIIVSGKKCPAGYRAYAVTTSGKYE
ncbi:MAG: hypothetical protein IKP65_01860 [Alphaproteobacteria bacterium]|nr:hypothetical protein [Alphaproteobacteria bacterium]